MKDKSPTKALVDFVVNTHLKDLPEGVIQAAKRCFLDWVGVTIGGMKDPCVKILVDFIKEAGGEAQASVIGYGIKTSVLHAAFVNGTMAHALDYDDAHMDTRNHPSAPLIAALLALGEYKRSSGSQLVTAFVLGFEVATRIGLALGYAYYDEGWHATPILGRFGVAAGVGKLLGLDAEKLSYAFGLAATQSGGIRKAFGTMGKPFNAGKAGMDGALSAMLARRGFTASKEILDEASGFGRMLSEPFDPSRICEGLGNPYSVLDVSFKPYAACLAIHPVISGLIWIRNEHRLSAESIEHIHLQVAPVCVVLGDNPNPKTGTEGKFSAYFCAALAVAKGQAGAKLFTDDLVHASAIRDLMGRTTMRGNESLGESEAILEVVLKDGSRFMTHNTAPKGDPRNPMTLDEIVKKMNDLARPLLPDRKIKSVISMIGDLENLKNVLGLVRLCCIDEDSDRSAPT
jgi:2-methylcitrate dehydratase PrpD